MNDETKPTIGDPLDVFLRLIAPEKREAARENLRWYVGFVHRLTARRHEIERQAALDRKRPEDQPHK